MGLESWQVREQKMNKVNFISRRFQLYTSQLNQPNQLNQLYQQILASQLSSLSLTSAI